MVRKQKRRMNDPARRYIRKLTEWDPDIPYDRIAARAAKKFPDRDEEELRSICYQEFNRLKTKRKGEKRTRLAICRQQKTLREKKARNRAATNGARATGPSFDKRNFGLLVLYAFWWTYPNGTHDEARAALGENGVSNARHRTYDVKRFVVYERNLGNTGPDIPAEMLDEFLKIQVVSSSAAVPCVLHVDGVMYTPESRELTVRANGEKPPIDITARALLALGTNLDELQDLLQTSTADELIERSRELSAEALEAKQSLNARQALMQYESSIALSLCAWDRMRQAVAHA